MGLIAWFKEKISRKISNWIFKNTSFPNGCKSGNELDWILKNNCPCCIYEPLENLSDKKYHEKYPAHNRLQLGNVTIYLCDTHFKKLRTEINRYENI